MSPLRESFSAPVSAMVLPQPLPYGGHPSIPPLASFARRTRARSWATGWEHWRVGVMSVRIPENMACPTCGHLQSIRCRCCIRGLNTCSPTVPSAPSRPAQTRAPGMPVWLGSFLFRKLGGCLLKGKLPVALGLAVLS